jgi:hypothetical protein
MLSAANGSTGSEPEQPKQDKSRARPDRLGAPALVSEGARLPRTEREAGPPMEARSFPVHGAHAGGRAGVAGAAPRAAHRARRPHTRGCIKAIRLRLPQFSFFIAASPRRRSSRTADAWLGILVRYRKSSISAISS